MLKRILSSIEKINAIIGKVVAWFTMIMVLMTCAIVLFRYAFNEGNIAVQELVMYFHAAVFMLGAAYTLQDDGFVRVDIFYQNYSTKTKAWLNLFGTIFLLMPMVIFIFWMCFDYVIDSWRIYEESRETGGLAYVYILKSFMLIMPVLLFLQGISEFFKQMVILQNKGEK